MTGASRTGTAQAGPADPGIAVLKRTLIAALQRDEVVPPAHETRVHAAIDLLCVRGHSDAERAQVEAISLFLHKMRLFMREGRVNAYASTRLRLRRAVEAL